MSLRTPSLIGMVGVSLLLSACDGGGPKPAGTIKKTNAVTGTITVDGKAPVQEGWLFNVEARPKEGYDPKNPTASTATTDENGKFKLGTYKNEDGIPAGDYVLIFTWNPMIRIGEEPPDNLKRKYNDPKKNMTNPKLVFTVTEGETKDLGTIDLPLSGGGG